MSNPYFARSKAFNGQGPVAQAPQPVTPAGYPSMPGYQPGGQGGPYNQYGQAAPAYGQAAPQVTPEQVRQMEASYGAPSATNVDRGRMTYDDVIIRTVGMFAVIVAVGAVTWNLAISPASAPLGYGAMVVGALGAFALGMVNSFKSEPSPVLILAYSAFEGAFLGALSGVMEHYYPGIVVQAVTGTLGVFISMMVLYRFGFRVTGRMARILMFAVAGYAMFSLINFVLMLTGATGGTWGVRSMEVFGIPLGLIIGPLAVIMAAFCLAVDFEYIQTGVQHGLPKRYAWAGAFGLVVTLVWLYVEILRIRAILQED